MSDVGQEGLLVSLAVRPMAKGMYQDRIAQLLESGAGYDVRGLRVTPNGLATEECFVPAHEQPTFDRLEPLVADELVQETDTFIKSTGMSVMFAITTRFLYTTTDLVTWTPVPWMRSRSWTSCDAGRTHIVVDDAWLLDDHVEAGFYARFGTFVTTIASVDGVGALTLDVALPVGVVPGAFEVFAPLRAVEPLVVQYARTPTMVVLADGWALRAFDGYYMRPFRPHRVDDDALFFSGARCVVFAGGRVLVASTSEATGRVRARWSSPVDYEEFAEEDYWDFTATQGAVMRLVSVEEYPVVVMEDGLAVGQPWGTDAPLTTPWIFRPVSTGGVGPVGPRALCAIPSGMVFLGNDDVYVFSPLKRTEKGDFVADPIKCPVRAMLVKGAYRHRTLMRYDPFTSRVAIAVPEGSLTYNDIVSWHFTSNEWSHRGRTNFSFTSLSLFASRIGATWQSWSSDGLHWQDAAMKRAWLTWAAGASSIAFVATDTERMFYYATKASGVDRLVDRAAGVLHDYPLERVWESADYDAGVPDNDKSWRKLTLRTRDGDYVRGALEWRVEGSTDHGRTWRALPTLTIRVGEDEGEVHFALKGTVARFRFTTSSTSPGWALEEFVMRLRQSGRQVIK